MQCPQREKVKFIIIHDYAGFPGECWPGEEVIAIILVYLGRRYWVPWGPTHMILADYLCRNRWIALDAWGISSRMQLDPFVVQHGTNAPGCRVRPARTSRAAVRQQIRRMREVLASLIKEEGLDLDAEDIIRSEETSTRVVRYRINADVSWDHGPRPDDRDTTSDPRLPKIHPALLGSGGDVGSGVRL